MIRYVSFQILCFLLILGCNHSKTENIIALPSTLEVSLLNPNLNYEAGDSIQLTFEIPENFDEEEGISLQLNHSYGTSIVKGNIIDGNLLFVLPETLSNKSGLLSCSLAYNTQSIWKDTIQISPNDIPNQQIETYAGPPTIIAGETDFAMLVAIATDRYDNLIPNGTSITLSEHFNGSTDENTFEIQDRFAFQKIESRTQTGRVNLGARISNATSKGIIVDIQPNVPNDISLAADRIHPYADGHEILTLTTDVIRDTYGNVVSDGTSIYFWIKDTHGNTIEAQSGTVQGVASAKLQHPIIPTQWEVKAGTMGVYTGEPLRIDFDQSVVEFPITYDSLNSTLVVGPISNVFNQLIPDGTSVEVTVPSADKNYELKSKAGIVSLPIDLKGPETIEVTLLGVTQELNVAE